MVTQLLDTFAIMPQINLQATFSFEFFCKRGTLQPSQVIKYGRAHSLRTVSQTQPSQIKYHKIPYENLRPLQTERTQKTFL